LIPFGLYTGKRSCTANEPLRVILKV
jgi:hypothetical protein